MHERTNFTNKLGFVLAAAGSAVGLGNIWRFPYLAAKYGGGMFLLIYLILVVSFGFSIMVAEIAIGRKTGLSPIGAFRALNKKYSFIGFLAALIAFLILPYYSVIGGWVAKYTFSYLTGAHTALAGDAFFGDFIGSNFQPVFWQVLFVLASFFIVVRGVKNGIEKASRILMPLLVVLTIIITIFSITRPGAWEGVKYYFIPDFSKLSTNTILAALGQMFYSMSLAMGIMITYGSYLRKEDDIEKSVSMIELFDTGIAFLAGLMIVPAVFAFQGPENLAQGPKLMFVTLPKVFESMWMGGFVGCLFFILVLFAALTSAISLMEAVTSTVCDQFHLSRKKSAVVVTICTILLGIPSALGYGAWENFTILGMSILDFVDFLTNSVLMPVTAFLTCIFVAYVIGVKAIDEEVEISSEFKRKKLFEIMIKYIAPICILAILISSILNSFGVITL